jgi:hypothetical protein
VTSTTSTDTTAARPAYRIDWLGVGYYRSDLWGVYEREAATDVLGRRVQLFRGTEAECKAWVAERTPLTDTTWASIGTLNRTTAPRSWEAQSDLAREAAELTAAWCSLTLDDWRVLIAAVCSGLPAVVEHVHANVPSRGTVERTTRTYVIDSLSLTPGVYDNVRMRCWGFNIPVSLPCVQRVTTPEAEYLYEGAADDDAAPAPSVLDQPASDGRTVREHVAQVGRGTGEVSA